MIPLSKRLMKTINVSESEIQDLIANSPEILGLGDLQLKDKERIHSHAGRLDILLEDNEGHKRYEVEVQLGATDPSHIIRTIEYWDIERKRYPQYEHVAVLVAEDITSRFFNVISLFNNAIPIIAIQMNAHQIAGENYISFTKVLDLTVWSFEEDEMQESTDRKYWLVRSNDKLLKIADKFCSTICSITNQNYQLTYKKSYMGLQLGNKATNFIFFRPRKNYIYISIKLGEENEHAEALCSTNENCRYLFKITDEGQLSQLEQFIILAEQNYNS